MDNKDGNLVKCPKSLFTDEELEECGKEFVSIVLKREQLIEQAKRKNQLEKRAKQNSDLVS